MADLPFLDTNILLRHVVQDHPDFSPKATALLRRTGDRPRLPRTVRQYAGLGAIAVIGGSVPFVLFFEGLARASSTHAAFMQKTLVVWVAALAVPLLGERLRAAHVAAMALIVGGLVLLDGGLRGFRFGDGELLILAATLLWAVEVVLAKRMLRGITVLKILSPKNVFRSAATWRARLVRSSNMVRRMPSTSRE